MAYADADDVRGLLAGAELLGTAGQNRLDLGRQYFGLQPDPNTSNPNTARLLRVRFGDDYFGRATHWLEFSDADNFDAYVSTPPGDPTQYVGAGDRNTTFTGLRPDQPPATADTMYTIESGDWNSSDPVSGTIFQWNTQSVISETDFLTVGDMADVVIDLWLLASRKIATRSYTSRLFTSVTVPDALSQAAMYMWAFKVYSRAYGPAKLEDHPKFQWWKIAENMTNLYLESLLRGGPAWLAPRPIFSISKNDDLGGPLFGFDRFYRNLVPVTIEAVIERMRDFETSADPIDRGPTTRDEYTRT